MKMSIIWMKCIALLHSIAFQNAVIVFLQKFYSFAHFFSQENNKFLLKSSNNFCFIFNTICMKIYFYCHKTIKLTVMEI